MKLSNDLPVIDIDLSSNGVYVFENIASTGKTRLCKELKKHYKAGEPVASYSYDDYLLNIPIESILIPHKYKVIMLDRYDLYNGVGKELIQACKEDSIILIDCKQGFNFSIDCEMCGIEMTKNMIKVVE